MVDHLKAKFKEEVSDYNAYKAMEKAALESGDRFAALWIMKIAEAEYSHAKWMRYYLKERNMFPQDLEDMWMKMKHERENH